MGSIKGSIYSGGGFYKGIEGVGSTHCVGGVIRCLLNQAHTGGTLMMLLGIGIVEKGDIVHIVHIFHTLFNSYYLFSFLSFLCLIL